MRHKGWYVALGLAVLTVSCRRDRRPQPSPPPPAVLTLVAVGDLLMHEDVKRSAERLPQGYADLWSDLESVFRSADLAMANLETPIAPRTGHKGRPMVFNAPEALAQALAASRVSVLCTANNHAYDQGPRGLLETLGHLKAAGLVGVGSGSTKAEAVQIHILERKGLRVGVLGMTDIFNNPLNGDPQRPWVGSFDDETWEARIREARPGVDLLVAQVHWGNEYWLRPSPRQRDLAQRLVAAGVDLVVGHHPHVLQPLESVQAGGRTGVVAFSLGNCVSNQDRMYAGKAPLPTGDNRDGGLLVARFQKGRPLEVRVDPLWTDNNWAQRQVGRESWPRIQVIRTREALESAKQSGAQERQRVLQGRLERALGVLQRTEVRASTEHGS